MGLQAKWHAKPCRTRPACEGAVVPRRAFISRPDQLPGGLRSPSPSGAWAFGPEEARPGSGFPRCPPPVLLHEADNLLFAVGLVRDGHRLVREGLVEIDLIEFQG